MADQFSPPSSRIAGIVIVGSIGSLLAAALLAYFAFAASVVDVPDFGGTYIEGTLGPPPTLVSILANDDTARTISGLIFNGLTRYAADGTVVPDLATGWEIDSQSRSFVFQLRDDVRWQDGTPLTVDDVLFTYGLLASPQRRDPVWSNVKAEREGERSVRISLLNDVYLPLLEYATIGILPRHLLDGVSVDQILLTPFNLEPVGTGPYRVVEFTEEFALLRANEDYFGGRPHIRYLKFKFYPNAKAAITALERGEVEGVSYLPDLGEESRGRDCGRRGIQRASCRLHCSLLQSASCPFLRSYSYDRRLPMLSIGTILPMTCREEWLTPWRDQFCRSPGHTPQMCRAIFTTPKQAEICLTRQAGLSARMACGLEGKPVSR